jgi:hypothetical protein
MVMSRFRSILKWCSVGGISLLLVLSVAWAVSRMVYPTEAQRQAIAQLEQESEYLGENAFALLWTLERDVPEDKLSDVMAEDVRRFSETARDSEARGSSLADVESAAEQFPDLSPSAEDRNRFCFPVDEDCLLQVRDDLEAHVALIERNEKLLDRIERLHDYEVLRSEFPPEINALLPPFRTAAMLLTRRAVDFASGREEEAVAATCSDMATWRRLALHADTIPMRFVAMAYATRYGHALAGMLAEWPLGRSLPARCDEALAAPAPADLSLCETMRGEFAVTASSIRGLSEPFGEDQFIDRWLMPLFFDAEATVGMMAEAFSGHCSESERERIVADRPPPPDAPPHGLLRFACVGNFAGCVTQSLSWSNHASYRNNAQDYGAKLRVLGTLAWLRREAEEGLSVSELLVERPDALKSPARDIQVGPEGKTLRVALYDNAADRDWSIPLPTALHPANGD